MKTCSVSIYAHELYYLSFSHWVLLKISLTVIKETATVLLLNYKAMRDEKIPTSFKRVQRKMLCMYFTLAGTLVKGDTNPELLE